MKLTSTTGDKVFLANFGQATEPRSQQTPAPVKVEPALEPTQTAPEQLMVENQNQPAQPEVSSPEQIDNKIQIAGIVAKVKAWLENFLEQAKEQFTAKQ